MEMRCTKFARMICIFRINFFKLYFSKISETKLLKQSLNKSICMITDREWTFDAGKSFYEHIIFNLYCSRSVYGIRNPGVFVCQVFKNIISSFLWVKSPSWDSEVVLTQSRWRLMNMIPCFGSSFAGHENGLLVSHMRRVCVEGNSLVAQVSWDFPLNPRKLLFYRVFLKLCSEKAERNWPPVILKRAAVLLSNPPSAPAQKTKCHSLHRHAVLSLFSFSELSN